MPVARRKPRSASSKGSVEATPQPYAVRSRSAASSGTPRKDREPAKATGWRMALNPIWCYHGFAFAVAILTAFGVVMVFSSSSVTMVAAGLSPWKQAVSQGMYALIGIVGFLMGLLGRYRRHLGSRLIKVIVLVALGVQLSTLTSIGIDVNGNRGWIALGPVTFQPAELLKLVLCLVLPMELVHAQRRRLGPPSRLTTIAFSHWPRFLDRFRIPVRRYGFAMLSYGVAVLLVLAGRDLGTCMVLVAIGLVALWTCGFPRKWLLGIVAGAAVGIAAMVLVSPNRMRRITATYSCSTSDLQDVCYQSVHAKYAMASGGLLGVGMGNSREKWNYLPEAHNDFIYAIIGEETGFVGAFLVLLLFVVIGWCLIVVSSQMRQRAAAASLLCFMVWLVGQALINMAVVLGILPVMGVPLPFVSAGGSSLVMCLTAAGVCMNIMRDQPQIAEERARV